MTEGAERLISTLKALGYRTAILSGGFQYFAEYLQAKLGIDEVHANILDVQNGMVTGEVKGHIVDGARKALLLREIADNMGISLEQTIAVGDGANDLPMLSIAGLGWLSVPNLWFVRMPIRPFPVWGWMACSTCSVYMIKI